MQPIMRSHLTQTYQKLIWRLVIIVTDSAIIPERSQNFSKLSRVSRITLKSLKRLPLSNAGLGIGTRQLQDCGAPSSSILGTMMPMRILQARIGGCGVFLKLWLRLTSYLRGSRTM